MLEAYKANVAILATHSRKTCDVETIACAIVKGMVLLFPTSLEASVVDTGNDEIWGDSSIIGEIEMDENFATSFIKLAMRVR